jgi:hypothetical protein
MNLEEARKVLWLKSNPRPVGELLDEGYLDQQRLEWAVQWAFNNKLKEAAGVILKSIKNVKPIEPLKAVEVKGPVDPIEIGMTIDKARSTLWPMAPYKGKPMGSLFDSKQLSLRDLGYAAENAWDEKVRKAAVALSLVRLEQIVKEPIPDAGPVRIVSGGRSYSRREEVRLTFIQGSITGFLFMVMIVLSTWLFRSGTGTGSGGNSFSEVVSTPFQLTIFVIMLLLGIGMIWLVTSIPEWISQRLDRKIEEHRFGQEGEEQVLQAIIQSLDGNWSVFQNVRLPGRNKGDLDLVLVGPPGLWVLEVKNYRGQYRNIGETWEYRQSKNWKVLKKSPSEQAKNNALRLKNFLQADNLNVFVNQAVVWVNQESPLFVENPSVSVWQYNRLSDELGNIWQVEKLSQEEKNKISNKLTKICERQKQL